MSNYFGKNQELNSSTAQLSLTITCPFSLISQVLTNTKLQLLPGGGNLVSTASVLYWEGIGHGGFKEQEICLDFTINIFISISPINIFIIYKTLYD